MAFIEESRALVAITVDVAADVERRATKRAQKLSARWLSSSGRQPMRLRRQT
jgi:UDP-N-acetyl-D-mannosaminuronic acid transferase (WecB/TagA/CpsF family)